MTIYTQAHAKLRQRQLRPEEICDIRDALIRLKGYGFEDLNVEDLLGEVNKDIAEMGER
jgi:hypothetical protein